MSKQSIPDFYLILLLFIVLKFKCTHLLEMQQHDRDRETKRRTETRVFPSPVYSPKSRSEQELQHMESGYMLTGNGVSHKRVSVLGMHGCPMTPAPMWKACAKCGKPPLISTASLNMLPEDCLNQNHLGCL